ncbi:MAG TPA: TetR/AcrR family transcriptional regulator [Solirubrobacterales bacterium]|nr:TetR/AcrR family transcriptional regulator [Solirubrobacterales bacterium]
MSTAGENTPVQTKMRREPVQARSQQRVKLLLDTTAELVDEVGMEGVTTGLLAERAKVSIGSVYRFFPDRISLMRALSERNLERYVTRFTTELEQGQVEGWEEALEITVDQFVEMHETEPGFRALRFGDVIDERLLDGTESNNGVLADPFKSLLVNRLGIEDNDLLVRQINVATEICDGLLSRAFFVDPEGDRWLIEECKTVVHDYLAGRLRLA